MLSSSVLKSLIAGFSSSSSKPVIREIRLSAAQKLIGIDCLELSEHQRMHLRIQPKFSYPIQ